MPIFSIHLTEKLDKKETEEMYNAVAKVIALHQNCPTSAVSGFIVPLELSNIGQGNKTWREILDET